MKAALLVRVIALSIAGAFWSVETYAAERLREIAIVLKNDRFTPAEVRVKAGDAFMLVVTNKDTKDEDFEIPTLDIERLVPAGRERRIKMPALRAGVYPFVGEHAPATAKGWIVAE